MTYEDHKAFEAAVRVIVERHRVDLDNRLAFACWSVLQRTEGTVQEKLAALKAASFGELHVEMAAPHAVELSLQLERRSGPVQRYVHSAAISTQTLLMESGYRAWVNAHAKLTKLLAVKSEVRCADGTVSWILPIR